MSPAAVAAAAGRPPYRARGQGRAPSFLRWPPLHVLGRGRSAGVRNAFTFASEVLCHVLLLPRALPRAPRSARRRVLPRATAAAAAAVSPAIASPTLVPSPTRRGKEPYLSADLPVALYLGAPPPRRTAAGAALLISHAPCCTSRCSRCCCCCCCCCCCDVSRRRLCNSPDSLWLAVELNSRPGLRTSLNYWKGIASPLVGRQVEKKSIYQISIYVLLRRTLLPSLQFSILRGKNLRINIYQGGKIKRFDNYWNRSVSFTIFTFVAVIFRRRPPSLFLIEEKHGDRLVRHLADEGETTMRMRVDC